jgi:hypothetical protein
MSLQPNPEFEAEMQAQAAARAALIAAAEKAQPKAEALIPGQDKAWMPRKGNQCTVVVDASGPEVRLVNTDHAGHLQEWGSEKNEPSAPLRRGVRAAGFDLHESS